MPASTASTASTASATACAAAPIAAALSADQPAAKIAAPRAPAKSVLQESRQIERAALLIAMGARMQVLESETTLSYERLIRLYKEVAGKSPSKGQLPFSTDWFLSWQENIHSSLFLNIYEYLSKGVDLDAVDLLTKAYRLYNEQIVIAQIERAAMLIEMGARMQVLESETTLSYERLIRLYKEVAGKSPS